MAKLTKVKSWLALFKSKFFGSVERELSSKLEDSLHAADFGVTTDGKNCTAELQNALNAALGTGRTLKLPHGIIMVDPDRIVIGNGSEQGASGANGLRLIGSGFCPYTRGGTVIKAASAGSDLIILKGLIEGLNVQDLQFDCSGIVDTGINATALVGCSFDGFGVYDWKVHGIKFNNRYQPIGGVTWSRTNRFKRFFITTSHNVDYSSALHLSGKVDPTNPPGAHDMHNCMFMSGTIQMNKRPTANACQGLYLGFTDSNQFHEVDVIMVGNGFGYGITFSDQDNPGLPYPQNNLFVGCSIGGDAPRVIGDVGRNYFQHYAMKDNESLPSNKFSLRGMTDEGLFFGPHGFEEINTELLLTGKTAEQRRVKLMTPDGQHAAMLVHNSTLGLEVHMFNGTTYDTVARFLPNGQIFMNFDGVGFRQLQAGESDSAGSGFRQLRIPN